MRRAIATACVLAIMAGGVWAQTSSSAAPAVHTQNSHAAKTTRRVALRKKKEKAAAPAQELPAQTTPPVPATLMNSAPVKPTVTMERGLLTIDAPNSTLSDVLIGVQKATGAAIEGASPTERVAVRLGPGQPERVLAALLRGTPYDYVILGSLSRQDVVTRVLLTQASASSGSPAAASAPSPASSESEPEPDASEQTGTPGFRPRISPHQPQPNSAQFPAEVNAQPNAESEQEAQQPPPQEGQQSPPQQAQQPPPQQAQPQPDQLMKQLQQLGLAAPTPTQPKQPQ